MTNRWSQINTALLLSISAQLSEGWYRVAGMVLAGIVTVLIIAIMVRDEIYASRAAKREALGDDADLCTCGAPLDS